MITSFTPYTSGTTHLLSVFFWWL